MVEKPNPIQPDGSKPTDPTHHAKKSGDFEAAKNGAHYFAHMTFTEKEWKKLMDVFCQGLSRFMDHVYGRMREEMKKDAKRSQGENPD